MDKNIQKKDLFQYVSMNILGMIGMSCYILADTFFIAKATGAQGLAALNFSLSIFTIMSGVGIMIGVGGSTRYSILKMQERSQEANEVFTHTLILGIIWSIVFMGIGIFFSGKLAAVLGACNQTAVLTRRYLQIILCYAPCFTINHILLFFVRNDCNPGLSMKAMLVGSFSNIVLDYIFMFPMSMGISGAALATGFCPLLSIMLLSTHIIRKKNGFFIQKGKIRKKVFGRIIILGLSSFIIELSSSVSLIVCNFMIMELKGDLGVAAYGIIANIALVGTAVFTGIAQGIQPIASKAYGLGEKIIIKKVYQYAFMISIMAAFIIYACVLFFEHPIIMAFNSNQNKELYEIAKVGMKYYFFGFFFAGVNITTAVYFSAVEQSKIAFWVSILRGCVILIPCVVFLSKWMGVKGIWISFVITEGMVFMLAIFMLKKKNFL